MMKKLLLFAALLLGCGSLKAQDLPVTASPADTLAPLNVYTVDSTLVGRSIFNLLPDQVKVHQSDAIRAAVLRRVSANEDKSVSGYRVRIFFDNKQTSRTDSEAALIRFRSSYPDIPAYRNFSNSFFWAISGPNPRRCGFCPRSNTNSRPPSWCTKASIIRPLTPFSNT